MGLSFVSSFSHRISGSSLTTRILTSETPESKIQRLKTRLGPTAHLSAQLMLFLNGQLLPDKKHVALQSTGFHVEFLLLFPAQNHLFEPF